MTKIRATLVTCALAALIAAGSWFGWTKVAEEFARRIDAWDSVQRANGFAVAHGAPAMSGFPIRWQAALAEPSLARADGQFSWRGPELRLIWRAWDPEQLDFSAPGLHIVDLALAQGPARITARLASAEAALRQAPAGEILTANIAGAVVDARSLGLAFTARSLKLGVTQRPEMLTAAAVIEHLAVTEGLDSPLGRDVEHLDLSAELAGPLDLSAPPRVALESFRDAGGTLTIKQLNLSWGPMRMRAEGVLTLDAELRPRGQLTAHVQGLADAIRRFEAAGALPRNQATGLKIAGALLTRPNGDGKPETELPLSFEGGTVFLGPVALAKLPALLP